jgi:hypothetical protein
MIEDLAVQHDRVVLIDFEIGRQFGPFTVLEMGIQVAEGDPGPDRQVELWKGIAQEFHEPRDIEAVESGIAGLLP